MCDIIILCIKISMKILNVNTLFQVHLIKPNFVKKTNDNEQQRSRLSTQTPSADLYNYTVSYI